MADGVIPDEIKQFLLRSIDSVAQWEGLLLLRANPDKEWSAEALAQNLYIGEQEVVQILARLVARSMIVAREEQGTISYRYQPGTRELDQVIAHAAGLYRIYLIPITQIIHSKPHRVQEFADAFRIKKE